MELMKGHKLNLLDNINALRYKHLNKIFKESIYLDGFDTFKAFQSFTKHSYLKIIKLIETLAAKRSQIKKCVLIMNCKQPIIDIINFYVI